jgi:hypothetical protein
MSIAFEPLPSDVLLPRSSGSYLSPQSLGVSKTSNAIMHQLKELERPSPACWSGSAGVHSVEEQLYDALAAFKIRTAAIAMHLDRDWRSKLFAQLDSLLSVESWEEADLPPTVASFRVFLRLITFIKPERRPGLGATHDGNLIATWTAGTNRLTIECLPRDKVRWALAAGPEGDRESAAGVTTVARIADVLGPYGPAQWFSDAGKA